MKEQTYGVIRHILTFAGGLLIAKGMISEELMLESVGILTSVIGVLWSIFIKRNRI